MTGPRIEVDLDAFRHNVATLSSIAAPARTMLAVKANAYGHGLLPLAKAALESGADSLAVLDVPAGLELRAAGIDVQLFAWMHGPATLRLFCPMDACFLQADTIREARFPLGKSSIR